MRARRLPEPQRAAVAHEIADVLLYLVRLADVLDIDPVQAALYKIAINARSIRSCAAYNKRQS